MKKQTKLLSKFAVLLATLGAGATLASAHVAAHADTLYPNGTPSQSAMDALQAMENYKPSAKDEATIKAIEKASDEHDEKTGITKEQETGYSSNSAPAKHVIRTLDSHKVISYNNKTSVAQKKTTKKVAKKAHKKVAKKHVKKTTVKKAAKKVAKKHAKRLFRIRVKAHKIYAYKTANFHHKKGRKAEKKGTKLYVYGIIKKGHKKFYKVYDGRVITASKSAVSVIPETMVQQ